MNMQPPTMNCVESDTETLLTSYPASSFSRPSSISSAPSSLAVTSDADKPFVSGAPVSSLFEIRDTPTAGRAVFATRDVAAGTLLWRSDDLTLSVLLREYRREVCGQCFAYDYGRDLPIRDQTVGFAFCSDECREQWRRETGEVGVQAWTEVSTLVKKKGNSGSKDRNEMVDIAAPRPAAEDIAQAWQATKGQAELIRTVRMAESAGLGGLETAADGGKGSGGMPITKQHRKAVQKALQQPVTPDIMNFCVGSLVVLYNHPKRWEHVLSLAVDSTPYIDTDDLHAFTATYLQLLAVLPLPLLSLVTPESLFLISSRDNHNAFGIRSLEDEGSELFGYGCWPAASYWNHSCGPNIEKRREGRVWEFRAGRDIGKGEEMCITYLGGEEKKWSREKRVSTLKRNWGFECGCQRCEGDLP
ncbi:hypothetical protein CORC01_11383 [Colletotrichum orchidophilum]|uniref:SET domain-containing protein n=1 Tax=Colletotrichum orchidophilum TaxID=1209926 RepID=A0A1G4AW23_9PEZI|nr:uncharacterized protein CORC01_11383 [Colletotrichum orchidophilum]OHE93315.1 hypothetical protein CORC01_11383 [Colletotrichum orchidophilum]